MPYFLILCTAVVPQLFLITYHVWKPYCHHIPPFSRKNQSTEHHAIKSLENHFKNQKGKYTKIHELIIKNPISKKHSSKYIFVKINRK